MSPGPTPAAPVRARFSDRAIAALERWEYLHRALILAAQTAVFAAALVGAFLLRFDFSVPVLHAGYIKYGVFACVVIKPLVFHWFDLDRGWWRYASIHDVIRLTLGNAAASTACALLILLISPHGFPRSIYLIDFALSLLGTGALRVSARLVLDTAAQVRPADAKRIFIYGAGAAGMTLLQELRGHPALGYLAVGFIDDNPTKHNLSLHGLRVFGGRDRLAELAAQLRIDEVLVAIPRATPQEMQAVLTACQDAAVHCRTIPALRELVAGRELASQIREVAVEDLLGRTPVRLDSEGIRSCLQGRTVLVTGAAGSIGSELCRQIARFEPGALVALDSAETPLFYLEQSLARAFPQLRLLPCIGNIQNRARMAEVLAAHRPAVLFHAAAYKHVPLMEAHVFEALENNLFGTRNLVLEAERAGVGEFVLISSDKAVRPANLMGATKRAAEQVVRSRSVRGGRFVAVRFGNVLGSNGSVVPTFKEQIARGGPVTVTHPEMRRYFMTIPEACQLVLQAAAMGQGGEVFVLDMGEPVRILDLARNLIHLSGHRPGVDIQIEFSGVRPGEKLSEELNALDENLQPTPHEKIRVFAGPQHRLGDLELALQEIERCCAQRDRDGALRALRRLVPDYTPASAPSAPVHLAASASALNTR